MELKGAGAWLQRMETPVIYFHSEQPVTVRGGDDEEHGLIGEAIADQHRHDLAEAGLGDGGCGLALASAVGLRRREIGERDVVGERAQGPEAEPIALREAVEDEDPHAARRARPVSGLGCPAC